MKIFHTPRINARYWTAITLASIFGTNLGDLYAHEAHLGIVIGIAVLALIAAIVFIIEHFESVHHQVWYWLVIVLIRTGATNIADYLAFRVRVPPLLLTLGLLALLCLFAFGTRRTRVSQDLFAETSLNTNAAYWLAMLSAGVFGTVLGDILSHAFGQGVSSLVLGAILLAVILGGHGRAARILALYWVTVAIARVAGTCMGDWLAENPTLHIGLTISTLITGCIFLAVLLFWPTRTPSALTSRNV